MVAVAEIPGLIELLVSVSWAVTTNVATPELMVAAGEIDPDQVHVPSIFVNRLFKGSGYQKWIEKRTVRKRAA